MHHSEQKCAHFCSEWCIVGYGTGAFWDIPYAYYQHSWQTDQNPNMVYTSHFDDGQYTSPPLAAIRSLNCTSHARSMEYIDSESGITMKCNQPCDKIYFYLLSRKIWHWLYGKGIFMAYCRAVLTPVCQQWSYLSLALIHWCRKYTIKYAHGFTVLCLVLVMSCFFLFFFFFFSFFWGEGGYQFIHFLWLFYWHKDIHWNTLVPVKLSWRIGVKLASVKP